MPGARRETSAIPAPGGLTWRRRSWKLKGSVAVGTEAARPSSFGGVVQPHRPTTMTLIEGGAAGKTATPPNDAVAGSVREPWERTHPEYWAALDRAVAERDHAARQAHEAAYGRERLKAQAWADELSSRGALAPAAPAVVTAAPGPAQTFGALGRQWTSGELAKLYPDHVEAKTSKSDDAQRLEVFGPALDDVPIAIFVSRGVELADAAMPDASRSCGVRARTSERGRMGANRASSILARQADASAIRAGDRSGRGPRSLSGAPLSP